MKPYTKRIDDDHIVMFPDELMPITLDRSSETFVFPNEKIFPAMERLCSFEEADKQAHLMNGTIDAYILRVRTMMSELARQHTDRYLKGSGEKPARKLTADDHAAIADMFVATHKRAITSEKSWDVTIKRYLGRL